MQLHLGADVRGREDEKLGELRRVLYDPATGEVTSLVVQHSGFDERRMLVPIGAIDTADHGGVVLALSRDQFEGLEEAGERYNVAPPPTADNLEVAENLAPEEVPDVPPVGAATGVESIAFTPVVEETSFAPEGIEGVDGDTVIQALDGELGRVADILVDDQTRRIQGFAVEKGLIFKSEVEVPGDVVSEIRPGTIVLNVERDALEGAGDRE